MVDLYQRSIQIILQNQQRSGAYVASPIFPNYKYCWFRDSAFISYSMDLVGEYQSSQAFHDWAIRTIIRYESKINKSIQMLEKGDFPEDNDYFHSRFSLDGMEKPDDWGHHQLDGLGTWLWSLVQHLSITEQKNISLEYFKAVRLVRDYLMSFWKYSSYDCWEENPDFVHTYTLAAIYAGLNNIAGFLNDDVSRKTANEVRNFVLQNAIQNGHFVKYIGSSEIDANLLGLSVPYELIDIRDDIMQKTISLIEKKLLSPSWGLHRYQSDSYYGGGEWILLSTWLGWYYAKTNRLDRSQSILDWIEKQASRTGELPEQVKENLLFPAKYKEWEKRWGKIASPLLWSHANYLILYKTNNSEK